MAAGRRSADVADNLAPSVAGSGNAATTPWHREITPQSWRGLGLAGLGWMFDVYDSFVLSLTIPALVAAFALSNAEAGAIGSILAAGLIIGGIIMGWVADRIGRVRTLYISIFVYFPFSPASPPSRRQQHGSPCCAFLADWGWAAHGRPARRSWQKPGGQSIEAKVVR